MKSIHSISLLLLSTATISGVISAPVLGGAADVETTSNDAEIMKRQNCVPDAEDVNTVESTPANSTLAKRNYDGVSYTHLGALGKKEHLVERQVTWWLNMWRLPMFYTEFSLFT